MIGALTLSSFLSAQTPIQVKLAEGKIVDEKPLLKHWVNGDEYTEATLTIYPANKPNGQAIIACPGGGYAGIAVEHEGHDLADWFNTQGITYCVLHYRMPYGNHEIPLSDAHQAIRYMRSHADELGIRQLGIMGFSAGAHLTATVAAPADPVPYEKVDALDELSCRPDFAALIYPAYLSDPDLNLNPEFKIDENTPPMFLLQTEDDEIRVECSLAWYLAMKRAKRPAEMHLFAEGGHGYGILRTGNPVANWPKIAAGWFERVAGKITVK